MDGLEKVVNEDIKHDRVAPTQTATAAPHAHICDRNKSDHSNTSWCTPDGKNSSEYGQRISNGLAQSI